MAFFENRREAGRVLVKSLDHYVDTPNVIVLGLPRGGIPVAFEVASVLHAPLDVFVVRKLGAPGQEELAIGAIASGGVRILNDSVVRKLDIPPEFIEGQTQKELKELERREQDYVGKRLRPELRGKTVILIDDGLATGASMYAAVAALREHQPARIVVAVPVASPQTCAEFEQVVEEVVCAQTPEPFLAVGAWYDDFSQTTDQEVRELLEEAAALSART